MFLDLEQLATYVGVTAAKDRAGLEADAESACQWVEDEAGPIVARTITELAWSTGSYCRLAHPAVTITSIDGVTDLPALTITPGGVAGALTVGWRTVVYTVGYAEPPAWAVQAAMAYTKHLWQARLGSRGGPGSINYGSRAEGLIQSHRRGARP